MTNARTLSFIHHDPLRILIRTGLTLAFAIGFSSAASAHVTADFYHLQQHLARSAVGIPPLIAMIAYVAGTFFTVSGLLKLKDWINEGDKSPLMAAMMRLIVAILLIALPHSIRVVNGTLFGRTDGRMDANLRVQPGQLSVFQKNGN